MKENQSLGMNLSDVRVSIRNLIRTISILLIALVFCPTFLASCSNYEVKISAIKVVTGIKVDGRETGAGNPFYIVMLLLPLVVFVILFIKSMDEKTSGIVIASCIGANLVAWFLLKGAIKDAAEVYYCEVKSTFWFFLCIILNLCVIILSFFVILRKLSLETTIIPLSIRPETTRSAINHVSTAVYKASDRVAKVAGDISNNTSNQKDKSVYGETVHNQAPFQNNRTKDSNYLEEYKDDSQNSLYIYFCTKCKKVFRIKGRNKIVKCSQCSDLLIDIDVLAEKWSTLDKTAQVKILKEKIILPNSATLNKRSDDGNSLGNQQERHSFFGDMNVNEHTTNVSKAMVCPKCKNKIDGFKDIQFCPMCGTSVIQNKNTGLQQFCPRCGEKREVGAAFCHECGYKYT